MRKAKKEGKWGIEASRVGSERAGPTSKGARRRKGVRERAGDEQVAYTRVVRPGQRHHGGARLRRRRALRR